VVDREMVGIVVPSDAEGCTTGSQRGICGIHQALPIAYAHQQWRTDVAGVPCSRRQHHRHGVRSGDPVVELAARRNR
jgi:hypothetical protein